MSRPRAPGRPSAESSPNLREHLLDAAVDCYGRLGIAGTSNRAVAQAAGTNPALVNYYFGDRERLRDAVVAERLMPAVGGMIAAVGTPPDDPVELALRFVDAATAVYRQHPWLPPLWVREVLCEGGQLRDIVFGHVGALPRLLAARFADAQAQGRLAADLDPRLLMVSLVGLTLFPAASAPIWRGLLGANDVDGDALRRHATALLLHGLRPVSGVDR